MNPFDSAWDFFKASGRRSIADQSASEGSSGGHMSRKERFMGAGFPKIRAAGYGPTGNSSGLAGSKEKGRQVKDYFSEPGATAPDPVAPLEELEPDFEPVEGESEENYEDLPDEAFPEGSPSRAQPPKSRGNPFTRSEPFDAAWALLKQWEDTDWGFTADPPATADPWADVDWTNMTMGPDGKPYSTKTDPMMADLSREGGMERWLNRQISPSPIPPTMGSMRRPEGHSSQFVPRGMTPEEIKAVEQQAHPVIQQMREAAMHRFNAQHLA
jgi:hypothetical protein